MRAVAVIPARHGSTRLPAKPLLRETGKYLVQHTYERVAAARRLARVIVATDDDRIADAVRSFGGEVALTGTHHRSGTDRVAEAARGLEADIVLNVQGDEPEVHPDDVDLLVSLMEGPGGPLGTLAYPATAEDMRSFDVVKVVCDRRGHALYFSRAPIPHPRAPGGAEPLKHLGIYAFEREFLFRFAALPQTPLEISESLEQLRALENGYGIRVGRAAHPSFGIDTPDGYRAFVARVRAAGGA